MHTELAKCNSRYIAAPFKSNNINNNINNINIKNTNNINTNIKIRIIRI